ncbi:hypothetical protein GCM10010329_81560 [Streptomyces spiroverticillatus]|uniref:Recombination endonuclease VII n=1 Tax=Streptomyces finlayi TaxID=67296 RepID=A0A918X779_9ACTN|nr:hypothetical protein GCM10010329_81560 [Streptomyces spiroverticillatus]GHD16159.1 hypothetical protein GCM10010334_76950 [Streptomyces finlayi]
MCKGSCGIPFANRRIMESCRISAPAPLQQAPDTRLREGLRRHGNRFYGAEMTLLPLPEPARPRVSSPSSRSRVPALASLMTPLLVARVLAAQRIIDRKYWNWCRGSGNYPCRNGTLDGVPACSRHLTSEELAAVDELRAGAARLVDRWLPHLPPACWFWPLPADQDPLPASTEDMLFTWQQSRCAICGRNGQRTRRTAPDALVLDHDHETGLVRGLLCYRCNKREGLQSPGEDGRYGNYRKLPPARQLGLTTRYSQALQLRVPGPRSGGPAADAYTRQKGTLRRVAPKLKKDLAAPVEGVDRQQQLLEEIQRTVEALVPVLHAKIEQVSRDHPQLPPQAEALVRWLTEFPREHT